jgi:hypothetical protein
MSVSKAQLKATQVTWSKHYDNLISQVKHDGEIQKQVAKDLSSKAKQERFCLFMELQFKLDKKVNSTLQNCINKPATQHYILKVPMDKPLTQKFSIRTASKELLKHKLKGKPITTQAQIDKKGVYHAFTYDKPKVKKPTQISATQNVVNTFSMTKVQYIANAEKLKFVDVD